MSDLREQFEKKAGYPPMVNAGSIRDYVEWLESELSTLRAENERLTIENADLARESGDAHHALGVINQAIADAEIATVINSNSCLELDFNLGLYEGQRFALVELKEEHDGLKRD
jgi:hypothetical protein